LITRTITDILKKKAAALKFIILLGIVSLLVDLTYEGTRSITGPYLAILGASATLVGVVAGFGEFIGFGLRIIFGSIADSTSKYWTITIAGTFLNVLVVPMLALANFWEIAIVLILAERLGKAIRTPARDVLLSHAAEVVGRGWGFGMHEAMDQIGAVLGPVIVSIVLYFKGSYSQGFGILLAPAILALVVVFLVKKLYPTPHEFETKTIQQQPAAVVDSSKNISTSTTELRRFPRVFWLYLAFVAISVIGFANFQLISFHFQTTSILSNAQIPALYATAMAVDALTALIIGRLFDKKGLLILITVPLLTIPITPLVFSTSFGGVLVGIILWGSVLGIQETIMKAAVANMIPIAKRGLVFGIFNAAYGITWLLGSTLMGIFYSVSISYIIIFSIIVELISVPLILMVVNKIKIRF
jgi:MFS family permease